MRVKHIEITDDYSSTSERFTGDLALITLKEKITFTDYIRPICIFESSEKKVFTKGIVAGWGKTSSSTNQHSDIPYAIVIPIVDDGSCYRNDSRLAQIAWEKSFCAGSPGMSACQGDSGSGFFVKERNQFYLKGVVSSAVDGGACGGNHLVVFTDFFKYGIKNFEISGKKKFYI